MVVYVHAGQIYKYPVIWEVPILVLFVKSLSLDLYIIHARMEAIFLIIYVQYPNLLILSIHAPKADLWLEHNAYYHKVTV
jgi:hypothetical protein